MLSARRDRSAATPKRPLETPRDGILVVTDRKFWRRSIGSEERIATLVLHLARAGFPITVAYVGRVPETERTDFEAFASTEKNLDILARATSRMSFRQALQALARRIRAFPRPQENVGTAAEDLGPVPIDGFGRGSPARREFVQRLLRESRPRVVLVEFLRLTYTVYPREEEAAPAPLYWIDTHDVMHERANRYRKAKRAIPYALTAQQETRMLSTYDAILAIQDKEAALFRRLLPDKQVLVVPHGITTSKDLQPPARGPSGPTRLGFLGGRDVSNRDSLDWFVEAIWPDIRARFGKRVELHVAGQVCQKWSCEAPGIIHRGLVDSAEQFWTGIDVAINPIRFGSGLKIKNVEALAFGCALLTTPIGAEGIEAASPAGLGIAETESEWKSMLVDWLDHPEPRTRVARQGRIYADTHLTEDIAFHDLRDLLIRVATNGGR